MDNRVLHQNLKALSCYSSIGAVKGSKPNSYLTLKLQAPLYPLDHIAQMAEQLTWLDQLQSLPDLICCRAFSCSGPQSKLAAFGNLVNSWSKAPKWRICCLQSPKRSTTLYISLLVVWGAKRNLSFTLKCVLWHAPHHSNPRNFTNVEGS